MQSRKITKEVFESTPEPIVKHATRMSRKMHDACKLYNVSRFHTALDTQKESN